MKTDDLSFEKSLAELESIAAKLESGETTLEESIKLYEDGVRLSKNCTEILEKAKQKVITLDSAESENKTDD